MPNLAVLNSFAIDQRAHIEKSIYDIKYPNPGGYTRIPMDTSADANADTIVKKSIDARGFAEWAGDASGDTPLVDFATSFQTHDIYTLDIGFIVNRRELARSIQAGVKVSTERSRGLRDVYERSLNDIALFGDAHKGMEGFYNSDDVPTYTDIAIKDLVENISITGGLQEAVNYFANRINAIKIGTLGTFVPTNIDLPLSDHCLLKSTIIPGGGTNTLLSFLETNLNVKFSAEVFLDKGVAKNRRTEQPHLTKNRMVVYTADVDLVKLHMPQPLAPLTPYTLDQKVWKYMFEARTGGVEWRVPATAAYIDMDDPIAEATKATVKTAVKADEELDEAEVDTK